MSNANRSIFSKTLRIAIKVGITHNKICLIDENSRSAYYGVCGELLILDHCTENAENDCEFNPL